MGMKVKSYGQLSENKNETQLESTFLSLQKFLDENGDLPDDYLKKCRLDYEQERNALIKNSDVFMIRRFVDSYRQFIFLDWQNIAVDLINANNRMVFYFFALLKQNSILPNNLNDCFAFQKYQELISNREKLRELFKDDAKFKIENVPFGKYEQTVKEKSDTCRYYVISIECGDYVCEPGSNEKKKVIEVATDVVLVNGLAFKGELDNDEIIYLEVPNV
ncbi:MAG TPA: hypothetical protein DCZ76_07700 [Treponema sp.]|nr:hypothetical protein [Treponema sp.]